MFLWRRLPKDSPWPQELEAAILIFPLHHLHHQEIQYENALHNPSTPQILNLQYNIALEAHLIAQNFQDFQNESTDASFSCIVTIGIWKTRPVDMPQECLFRHLIYHLPLHQGGLQYNKANEKWKGKGTKIHIKERGERKKMHMQTYRRWWGNRG